MCLSLHVIIFVFPIQVALSCSHCMKEQPDIQICCRKTEWTITSHEKNEALKFQFKGYCKPSVVLSLQMKITEYSTIKLHVHVPFHHMRALWGKPVNYFLHTNGYDTVFDDDTAI